MTAPALEAALGQIQTLASQAAGKIGSQDQRTTATGGFADELHHSLQRINALQQHADTHAKAFQAGAPGVELQDVMIDSQKASIAFQMGVQLRNRLVTAYKDVMNMQV